MSTDSSTPITPRGDAHAGLTSADCASVVGEEDSRRRTRRVGRTCRAAGTRTKLEGCRRPRAGAAGHRACAGTRRVSSAATGYRAGVASACSDPVVTLRGQDGGAEFGALAAPGARRVGRLTKRVKMPSRQRKLLTTWPSGAPVEVERTYEPDRRAVLTLIRDAQRFGAVLAFVGARAVTVWADVLQ